MSAVNKSNIVAKLKLAVILFASGYAIAYFMCLECNWTLTSYNYSGLYSAAIWISLWIGNDWLAHWLDNKISWTEKPVTRLVCGLVLTVAYTISVLAALTAGINAVAPFEIPLDKEIVITTLVITFIISGIMHGRSFLLNWRKAALEAETMRKETALARYEALSSQLNPHFLFNSLHALTNLVYEDQEKAASFIKQLAEVYRYVLDTREKEVVGFEEEMKFVRSYLFLQQIRFGDNLHVQIELTDEQGTLPPLALQLLLENAINHNIISRDTPLTIRIFKEGEFVGVENSLQRKAQSPNSTPGVGLENIRRRYSFLTERAVRIEENTSTFRVILPLLPVS